MRTYILIFSLFISGQICGQTTDTLRSKHHYYDLRTSARLILSDSISPSDNFITFSSMDSITSDQKEVRDFYFPVFQKIVEKTDGALSEVIGSYVLAYVKKYPKEFSDRYKCCSKAKKCCDELLRLASFAGEETMARGNDKKEYEDLIGQMTRNYKNWRSDSQLKKFMNEVDTTRRNSGN